MLLVDKIYGVTSFVVVYTLRKQLTKLSGEKWIKVGHAGTLDPLATGLVIVGSRRATRSLTSFLGAPKEYQVELRLGVTSPSFDLEKPITVTHDLSGMTVNEVQNCILQFIGKQSQLPPAFSAIKQNGKPVYKKAHKGKAVELAPKEIEIYSIDDISVELPYARFTVRCSKGTYIRSLVNDIGERLGTGATLTNLRRTKIGEFSIENAIPQQLLSTISDHVLV
jgi:tRNA pseudouridine55 synthase